MKRIGEYASEGINPHDKDIRRMKSAREYAQEMLNTVTSKTMEDRLTELFHQAMSDVRETAAKICDEYRYPASPPIMAKEIRALKLGGSE